MSYLHSVAATKARSRPICVLGAVVLIAAGGLGCGEEGNFIATEPIGSAEVRIILTNGRGGPRFQVLTRTEPFVISASTLQSELENGGQLNVWIFAYRLTDLVERFEGLRDVSVDELPSLIQPSLDPPAAGRYEPPAPTRALRATIAEGGDRSVTYEDIPWGDIRTNPDTAFTLTLDGTYACPPLDQPFRVFRRGTPGSACVYRRDNQCRWVNERCGQSRQIFGADSPAVRQGSNGTLTIGERDCASIDAQTTGPDRGETSAWNCGDRVIAVQRQVSNASGEPWRLRTTTTLANNELTAPGRWSPSNAGAWYISEPQAGELRLRRVLVEGLSVSYQPSSLALPDDGDDRSVSSPDGLRVTLDSGAFKFSVGKGSQCFRLFESAQASRYIPIDTVNSVNSLSLTPPGIGEPINLGSRQWAVAGAPGQIDSADRPGQEDIRLPSGMGSIGALSLTADLNTIVVHGTERTVRIPRITRVFGIRNLFGCPSFVPHPPGLIGPIVAAGRQHFALMADGVLRLDTDGTPLERATVSATYDPSFRLERRGGADGGDLGIVYRPGDARIWVFAEGSDPFRVDLSGPILATINGPRVIVQTGRNRLNVRAIDPMATTEVSYQIPAFDDQISDPIAVAPDAIVEVAGTTIVGFSQGAYVGLLDLGTGLSQGWRLFDGAMVEAIFIDEVGQNIWLFTRGLTPTSTRELVQAPLPPRQL
ncbi:MAG: hypothetical protein AAF449_07525 [Myxococcota bacterium]